MICSNSHSGKIWNQDLIWVNWLCWDPTDPLWEERYKRFANMLDIQNEFWTQVAKFDISKNVQVWAFCLAVWRKNELSEQKLFWCRVYLLLCWTINGNYFFCDLCFSALLTSESVHKYWSLLQARMSNCREIIHCTLPQLKHRINSVQMLNKWFEFCCRRSY